MTHPERVKILLVDDLSSRMLSYEAILSDLGHELVMATSGQEALRLLMRDDFALILLDVNMPMMDGFETAMLIHQHPRFQNTPIIFVTAYQLTDLDRLKAYELGAVDYVFLPVVPAILRSKVTVLVELYQKRRELQRLNESLRLANTELAEANGRLQAERTRELERFAQRLEDANAELEQANTGLRAEVRERVRAEDALRASEGRLRAILQHTSALIYQTDLEGRFVHVNRRFEEFVQRPTAELVGLRPSDVFPGPHAQAMEENNSQVLACELPLEFEEHMAVRGDVHVYRSVKAPLFDEAGVLRGIVGVSTDVTERKRLVEELREADRRKDEFLAMLAHELRNPLAPIASAARLMRLRDLADPELIWCRDVIGRQSELLARLVDDLLDISRISYGKITLRKETVELNGLIARAIEAIAPGLDERRQRLRVELPSVPLLLEADPMRVAQVVTNLLSNAGKYSADGSEIRLTVEESPATLPHATREVEIRIEDEGIGIAPEDLSHVFDLFMQATPTAHAQGGLGIGLALVHRLVTLHGGTVTARSDGRGKGATFAVRLPLCAEPLAPAETPQLDPAVPHESFRVLIVDDNVDSAVGLSLLLRRGGDEVCVVHDGFAALREAEAFRPDVALLDIGMPEMDGYELAQRIRQSVWGARTVLIAMTGWSQEEARARIVEAGFDLHLIKPLDGAAVSYTHLTLPTILRV